MEVLSDHGFLNCKLQLENGHIKNIQLENDHIKTNN